jgi:hypothetical protein
MAYGASVDDLSFFLKRPACSGAYSMSKTSRKVFLPK